MSAKLPLTTLEGVHIEVAYRKVKGRSMKVDIASDSDEAPGYITVEELNPGQVKLVAHTKDGTGSAWLILDPVTVQRLRELLP